MAKGKQPVYKSKLEVAIASDLERLGIKAVYEPSKLNYTIEATYTPDWITYPKGIILEGKGVLDYDTRRKMLAVKKRHPQHDIRFIFQKASNKIGKGSRTTYGEWADKNGFKWCELPIPKDWLK